MSEPESLGPEGIRAWYERKKEERREYVMRRRENARKRMGRIRFSNDGTVIRQRRPNEPTRQERRARPSTGTNQPRPIRVIKIDGEPCKWPQMAHCEMERVKGTYR